MSRHEGRNKQEKAFDVKHESSRTLVRESLQEFYAPSVKISHRKRAVIHEMYSVGKFAEL